MLSIFYRGLTLFLRGTPQKLLNVDRLHKFGWENKIELEKGIMIGIKNSYGKKIKCRPKTFIKLS